jgi:hypothetical protein
VEFVEGATFELRCCRGHAGRRDVRCDGGKGVGATSGRVLQPDVRALALPHVCNNDDADNGT